MKALVLLQIFGEYFGSFFSNHISTLHLYLKVDTEGKSSEGLFDQKVSLSTAAIFRDAIPASQDLDLSLLLRIEADLIAILGGRGNVPLIEVAVPCLCEVSAKTSKYNNICTVLVKCVGFLTKIKNVSTIPVGAFMNFVKSLLITSSIIRYVDLEAITLELGESTYGSLFGKVSSV